MILHTEIPIDKKIILKQVGLKYLYNMTSGYVGFLQITRIAQSFRLGSLDEFVVGHDESKSTKTIIGYNNHMLTIEHI